MNIDLTPIIQAIIALIAAIITAKVIPWIKARTTNEQHALLKAVTTTLVFAAEQLYGAGNGRQKLDYVIAALEEKGYTADIDMIEATIRENSVSLHLDVKEDIRPASPETEAE